MRFTLLLLFCGLATNGFGQTALTGVNLAGADFGEGTLPGEYNRHYTYPTMGEVDYFVGIGMNVFRLPFRWERLQQAAYAPLDADELARMDTFVHYATAAGAKVILDPHNYARYYGDIVGSDALAAEVFGDFWARVAAHYTSNENVIFGLVNEPNTMPTELWLKDANVAIAAIREAGATNLILVPGNAWTGAHSWTQNWYGTPNGTVMQGIVDPLDNYAFELHQYFDSNSSGTSPTCVSPTVGSERLVTVTNWLRQHEEQGFLGEFGVANNSTCLQALDDMLDFMDANADVWLGWTYWAAGPWWGDYMFSIEPDAQGNDAPQTAVLRQHFAQPVHTEEALPETSDLNLTLWPNPILEQATLEYTLTATSPVAITLFDVLGREVRLLQRSVQIAGTHTLSVSTNGLPAGMYLLRVQTERGVSTQPFAIVR